MIAAHLISEACRCAESKAWAGMQAIKQQSQPGQHAGLGKLYSNLLACMLQLEHLQEAFIACEAALQVNPFLAEAIVP